MLKPRLKLVAFDMDGTITNERSSWEYLHRRMGIWNDQAEKFQHQFLKGEINYAEFCRLDALMWNNLPLADLITLMKEIKIQPGAEELIQLAKAMGAKPVLISTGLQLLADLVHEQLDFYYHQANELTHHEGTMSGCCTVHVSTDEPDKTKGALLKELMRRLQAGPQETVAIGDSVGDLEMMQEAGLSFAINPRPEDYHILSSNVPNLIVVQSHKEVITMLKKYFIAP